MQSNVVIITLGVTIFAKRSKKYSYARENHNDTKEENNITLIDLNGSLRKSFYLLSADRKLESNTLCSPLSALLPLAKLALGAEGESLDELLISIGVSRKSKIYDYYQPLLTRLRYLPGVKVDIASRLFVSNKKHLLHDFNDAATDVFDSSIDKMDFTFPSYAADKINSWISTQTNGFIKDILEPKDISDQTSLILVNAIYFNGRWTIPFTKVSNITFYYSPSRQKNIEMMRRDDEFNYTKSEALASEIISIPYEGGGASLVVVKPEARRGLGALLAVLRLTGSALSDALLTLSPKQLEVTMPKFKLYDELDLGLVYRKMGVKTIFDVTKSGLKKILQDETVFVTKAKQKCYIDVNEYGTEAAATSVFGFAKLSLTKSRKFLVNHPFLYFILVNDQQLFSGTFVNPESQI